MIYFNAKYERREMLVFPIYGPNQTVEEMALNLDIQKLMGMIANAKRVAKKLIKEQLKESDDDIHLRN